METSFWGDCPDQWIKKAKVFYLFCTLLLERVNQRGGEAVFGLYMRCVMRAPSLSCALRTVDAASARAAMRADGEDGKEEGGDSLSLSIPSLESLLLCSVTVRSRQLTNMPHAPSSNLRVNARTGRIGLWVISRHRCNLAYFFKSNLFYETMNVLSANKPLCHLKLNYVNESKNDMKHKVDGSRVD